MFNYSLLSSSRSDWTTPPSLFSFLNDLYHFTLDPCASSENHLCDKFFTLDDDGLSCSWLGETVFCNPPYGRLISRWIDKSISEASRGVSICLLVPSRTDTIWFHKLLSFPKSRVCFLKGRLKFGGSSSPAPFPSCLFFLNL